MAREDDVRQAALALPGVTEQDHHGRPSFRAGGRIFATIRSGEDRAMVKLPLEEQAALLASGPATFEPAAGSWGARGSTLVRLSLADAAELAELVALAWLQVARKRDVAAWESGP
jgi:hypothetical protein